MVEFYLSAACDCLICVENMQILKWLSREHLATAKKINCNFLNNRNEVIIHYKSCMYTKFLLEK